MIELYQFPTAYGLPNLSPFCMKLETYLRMAGIPYEIRWKSAPFGTPKGKLPYIRDGETCIGDSSFVIEYLKGRYGDALDGWLTPEQRATALALQRLMEEHLYWAVLYLRWIEDSNWSGTRQAFFGGLPPVLRTLVPMGARRGMRRELHGHGMGRHSRDEITALANADVTALAAHLGDKTYMMGDRPCSLDAIAYAFLANLLWVPLEYNPILEHARTYPTLESYCQRMKARYFAGA